MSTLIEGTLLIGLHWNEMVDVISNDIKNAISDEYDGLMDWLLEYHDFAYCAVAYDSGNNCHVGYKIDNVGVESLDRDWLIYVNELAEEFEKITGLKPKLIGCQSVC